MLPQVSNKDFQRYSETFYQPIIFGQDNLLLGFHGTSHCIQGCIRKSSHTCGWDYYFFLSLTWIRSLQVKFHPFYKCSLSPYLWREKWGGFWNSSIPNAWSDCYHIWLNILQDSDIPEKYFIILIRFLTRPSFGTYEPELLMYVFADWWWISIGQRSPLYRTRGSSFRPKPYQGSHSNS